MNCKLMLSNRSFTALVRSYDLRQEFITAHSSEQKGLIEREIRPACIGTGSNRCNTPVTCSGTGFTSTTTSAHTRR